MDTDRAYLLGLVIGGGIWGNAEDVFRIRLPYKKWGSYAKDPIRGARIASDIVNMVKPLFQNIYGITVYYDGSIAGGWSIICDGDLSGLISDLDNYGIPCEGELRKSAVIDKVIPDLIDDTMKRRFIVGLADIIGSTNETQRSYSDDNQIISFEISGMEYRLAYSLCKLLHSIKCFPNQAAWNHPNFQSPQDPYFKKWKKGFKIRVLLDQYEKFGGFAFASKAESAAQNIKKQVNKETRVVLPCSERHIKTPRMSCVHCDENSELLPSQIRGGHYFHYSHVCAVLGCEYAPYEQISKLIDRAECFINPFPILVKGTQNEIDDIIAKNPLFANRQYSEYELAIATLHDQSINRPRALPFSINKEAGYPINQVLNGITYLVAAEMNALRGHRVDGEAEAIRSKWLKQHPESTVRVRVPEILTPMVLSLSNHSVMVGPVNPLVYKKLIQTNPNNRYKLCMKPISEEDLK